MPWHQPELRSDLRWIGVDLDGTLAEPLWTPENPTTDIGSPMHSNIRKLKVAVNQGYKAVIHTSRPWTEYEAVESWLRYHDVPFREIQMGKPLYKTYVDDRAVHESSPDWTRTDYTYDAGYEAALAEVYIFLQMFPAEQVKSIVKGLIGEEK